MVGVRGGGGVRVLVGKSNNSISNKESTGSQYIYCRIFVKQSTHLLCKTVYLLEKNYLKRIYSKENDYQYSKKALYEPLTWRGFNNKKLKKQFSKV